jgi:diacylglycerol kinase family enzyme
LSDGEARAQPDDEDPELELQPVDGRRRLAAFAALVSLGVGLLVAVLALHGEVLRVASSLVLLVVMTVAGWFAATRLGLRRIAGLVLALVSAGGLVALTLTAHHHGVAIVALVATAALSAMAARYALRRDPQSLRAAKTPGTRVGPGAHAVLIVNPKSGGGKAERFHLVEEARRRGVQPIVLEASSDLRTLAQEAIGGGADVIGMAGGDGSQALVASVAMRHDVAHVCIPAGTRNHFALDLGLDRDDVVGAMDAFGEAIERRVDLADVNGRVFVNNVSLGVYAKIVQSAEYRDAKRQTTAAMLPELLGPDAKPFGLRFVGPDHVEHESAALVLVSNNPYVLTRLTGFGTRARLDAGVLGISAIEVRGAMDFSQLAAAEAVGQIRRYRGLLEWQLDTFTVESDTPVEAGLDGEAVMLAPPLQFRSLPGALRVRLPPLAPGRSPAALAAPSTWWTVTALLRTIAGRPTPVDEAGR